MEGLIKIVNQYVNDENTAKWLVYIFAALLPFGLFALQTLFSGESKPKKVLKPDEWQHYKLVQKDHLTHNTALYRFGLPSNAVLGLPIGQHISVSAEINGKNVMRSYTPTTLDDDVGHFDLVVKTYDQGNISRWLSLLTIGQEIKIKGPKGKFIYSPTLSHHLLMIAGGTGITPMYQIIRASLKDPNDKTQLRLVYGNIEETDILLRKELEELEEKSNGRLKVYHVLNKPPANWSQGTGFITRDHIEQFMPEDGVGKPIGGSKVLMCGPPPMISAMKNHLSGIGYPPPNTISKLEDQVFCF